MSSPDIPEGLEELFQQTWFDHFLHYGLFLGAIFQLICIAAIVIIPPKSDEDEDLPGGEAEGDGGSGTDGKKGQDVAQVVKGSGPGASSSTQGHGGGKNKTGAGKKARKRK